MKKAITFLFILIQISLYAQVYQGQQANDRLKGSNLLRYTERSELPEYVQFSSGNEIPEAQFFIYLKKQFALSEEFSFEFIQESTDELGMKHSRFQTKFRNAAIHQGVILLHSKDGLVFSFQGNFQAKALFSSHFVLTEVQALEAALEAVPADLYKWQIPAEEAHLKAEGNFPNGTYAPIGSRIWFPAAYPELSGTLRSAWSFEIYAHQPLARKRVIVDAQNATILHTFDLLQSADVPGTANTKYSGIQEIVTDSYLGSYRLREAGRGNGIRTFNLQNGTNYSSAVDFTDTDNFWDNVNSAQDEVATDAHWGMEMTYDYFYYTHNRNSIDGSGFTLLSYVHYDNQYSNAFWDGYRMTFGDGDGNPFSPLTALDIVGHEISHGLTTFTANLDYAYESGAINESYSDIFGTAIENYGKPQSANWLIGEDIGSAIRSMSNPNSFNDPDTYQGINWVFGSEDNGGVHTNSGVMNYWYYLICMGGSGTNDNGNAFTVNSITRTKADKIAFRTLVNYLTNTSDYADARFYSILAAIDLYGACSDEVENITKAWYAVGVGPNYVDAVVADFSSDFNVFCSYPISVQFDNLSINGLSFSWNFGDGGNSSQISPSHTYTAPGLYTVSLIVDGGGCGMDTIQVQNYISIDPANPCVEFMGTAGSQSSLACDGYLFDSGGASNYQDETNSIFTIAPPGALAVTLNFSEFSFEQDYDFLYIYDGPNTSSPLIGTYTGNALPGGGIIVGTSGAITLKQSTDVYLTASGFELTWTCVMPNIPPVAAFTANGFESCDGQIKFLDQSSNLPNAWLWNFGDGNTSSVKNPLHQYQNDGVYTVSLKVFNNYGSDSLSIANMIVVDSDFSADVPVAEACQGASVTLSESDGQTLLWYGTATDLTPLSIGNSYTLPALNQNTTLYVESIALSDLRHIGKPDNSGGGSNFTSAYEHFLAFDVINEMRLVSVKVYSGQSGSRLIKIIDSQNNTIYSAYHSIGSGEQRVYLQVDLPVGLDYKIVGPVSPGLYRNNAGVNYPYLIDNLASINYSSAGNGPTDPTSLSYYYFFYDWEVIETSCISERTEVYATVAAEVTAEFSYQLSSNTATFTSATNNASSFHWNFGDGTTSTEENPIHHYTAAGTYTVVLTASNACDSEDFSREIQITIGISSENDELFSVYPNPTSGQTLIQFPTMVESTGWINLYNPLGQLILKQSLKTGTNSISINLQNFADGIYFLEVIMPEERFSDRIIIRK